MMRTHLLCFCCVRMGEGPLLAIQIPLSFVMFLQCSKRFSTYSLCFGYVRVHGGHLLAVWFPGCFAALSPLCDAFLFAMFLLCSNGRGPSDGCTVPGVLYYVSKMFT